MTATLITLRNTNSKEQKSHSLNFIHYLKDTLCIALQNGFIWLVGMLHGNCLWEFSQHSLLEGFKPLIVVPTANKLLILCQKKKTIFNIQVASSAKERLRIGFKLNPFCPLA